MLQRARRLPGRKRLESVATARDKDNSEAAERQTAGSSRKAAPLPALPHRLQCPAAAPIRATRKSLPFSALPFVGGSSQRREEELRGKNAGPVICRCCNECTVNDKMRNVERGALTATFPPKKRRMTRKERAL